MTAQLVLLHSTLSDVVRVSAAAASQTGSVLGLRAGERISVRNLLYALLLQSSNDAAVALAEHVAGTVSRFVQLMNRRAAQLGLRRTRFFSPTGLDDRGHSTALELITMTRAAYRSPAFARMVMTKERDVPGPGMVPRHLQNRNVLLWLYRGARGVKTAFTSHAGHCLAATAARSGRDVVAIVLGDQTDPFDDAAALLNFGFSGFTRRTVLRAGQPVGGVRVAAVTADAVAGRNLSVLVRRRGRVAIHRVLRPARHLPPSIQGGQTIGREVVFVRGHRAGAVRALAAGPVRPSPLRLSRPSGGVGPLLLLVYRIVRMLAAPFL